jgi:hypothetical protein
MSTYDRYEELFPDAAVQVRDNQIQKCLDDMKHDLLPILDIMDNDVARDDLARAIQLAVLAADGSAFAPANLAAEMLKLIRKAVSDMTPEPSSWEVSDYLRAQAAADLQDAAEFRRDSN